MPNWVWNKLTVLGCASEVDRFIEQGRGYPVPYAKPSYQSEGEHARWHATRKDLTFDGFVRVPDEIRMQAYDPHGHTWQRAHWGTKWDAHEVEVLRNAPHAVTYMFQTAWCEPRKVILAMIAQYPACVVVNSWYEEDCSYGRTVGVLGVVRETTDRQADGLNWSEFHAKHGYEEDSDEGADAWGEYWEGLKRVYYDAHEVFCATHEGKVK